MSASLFTGYTSSNSFASPGNRASMRWRKASIVFGNVAGLLRVVHSFAFDPTRIGTSLCFFCAKRLRTSSGSTQPSTLI